MKIIELEYTSQYETDSYGIAYRSSKVHEVKGQSHNRNFPHRLTVWSNVNRPNKWPEGEWTNFGFRGGPGKYVDPSNKGTDAELSFTISAEASVISAHGDGTGTAASGQVWGEVLSVGDVVMLRTPAGGEYGPFEITNHRFHGLSLQ